MSQELGEFTLFVESDRHDRAECAELAVTRAREIAEQNPDSRFMYQTANGEQVQFHAFTENLQLALSEEEARSLRRNVHRGTARATQEIQLVR